MPKRFQGRVSVLYHQGRGQGTGLGLSMVQGLMAQSGGKLVLKSTHGEGTTAELWLPQADNILQEETEQPQIQYTPTASPLRVLAVDDDPLVLMNTVFDPRRPWTHRRPGKFGGGGT